MMNRYVFVDQVTNKLYMKRFNQTESVCNFHFLILVWFPSGDRLLQDLFYRQTARLADRPGSMLVAMVPGIREGHTIQMTKTSEYKSLQTLEHFTIPEENTAPVKLARMRQC